MTMGLTFKSRRQNLEIGLFLSKHVMQKGLAALSDYGVSNDGLIDSADDVFERLQVWTDTNSDGISQEDELHSLSDLHIESIRLNATEVNTEEKWNQISHESSFVRQEIAIG